MRKIDKRLFKNVRKYVRSLAFNKKLLFLTKTIEKICLFLEAVTNLSKRSK